MFLCSCGTARAVFVPFFTIGQFIFADLMTAATLANAINDQLFDANLPERRPD